MNGNPSDERGRDTIVDTASGTDRSRESQST